MRTPLPQLAAATALVVAASFAALVAPVSAASSTYLSTMVSEVPTDLAVADDGSMAVALYEAHSVVLLSASGTARSVDIGCAPNSVDVAPDGSTAWAVCQGAPTLAVIDVAAASAAAVGLNLVGANDVVYSPAQKRLYIADLGGTVVVVSVQHSADYEVLQRVTTPSYRPSWVAPLSTGTVAYVATDAGNLLSIDMKTSTVKEITPTSQYLVSLALSADQTRLYAGAITNAGVSSVLALNPANGNVLQALELAFTSPGATTISVAPGYQSMSVATGLGLTINGEVTGMFDVALDAKGTMGAISNAVTGSNYGATADRSASGQRAAFSGTNGQIFGLSNTEVPYPANIVISAKCTAKNVIVRGVTTGIVVGSKINVSVKRTGPRTLRKAPVPVSFTTYVTSNGTFRWKGRVKGTKLRIVAKSAATASNVVTCVR